MQAYLNKVEQGFQKLSVSDPYKKTALQNIETWLTDSQFSDYQPQLKYLIDAGAFELLLDAFYQIIPFGTGGRRGPVGIGTNRINPWTIQASAQGHSQYLLKLFGEEAKKRGLVICYDVRKYPPTKLYSPDLPNPIQGLSSKDIALCAAQVYTANGIRCYLFDGCRSTPELSFAIRYTKAVSGIVISASHNPKEDNGKKVYSHDGGQLIPPEDQKLSDMVNSVEKILKISVQEARQQGLLNDNFGKEVDEAYVQSVTKLSLLGNQAVKDLKIVYSPLHGVGMTSVYRVLTQRGFQPILDDKTATPDGFFPNVKFYIPNPEVVESMETLIAKGKEVDADVLINSDPDADRLGIMAKTQGSGPSAVYRYFNGNEIGIILTHFVLDQLHKQKRLPTQGIMAKTTVTSELIAKIAQEYKVEVIGELLVGFKYIGDVIKKLEDQQSENRFILGMEESHGFLVGTYTRDKDAAGAALLLCEAAALLKSQGKNLAQYLDDIYTKYGYASNKQASLIFLGAEGKGKIDKITEVFRKDPPQKAGQFRVIKFVDRWQGEPILSPTDRSSRNVLSFFLEPPAGIEFIKLTIRPSGTEPKIKIYIEVGGKPLAPGAKLSDEQEKIHRVTSQALISLTQSAYQAVGIVMPDRGFKLSSLLPVETKQKYFDVETQLLQLEARVQKNELAGADTKKRVDELLAIFGKDPIEKISDAFQEKSGMPLRAFLQQKLKI